ncbi:MAG: RNA polymerase sigma factor [Planctomycetota bacterium]|jgi:RNA polymerase sigma-70 factor (ECF subfamily)
MRDVDLNACIGGRKAAWDTFVDQCSPVIYAAVRRTLGGRAATETDDVVQNVFMRLVRNDFALLKSYDPSRAALSTWLTLVARSVAIDAARRKRLDVVGLDTAPAPPAPPPPRPAAEPDALPLDRLTGRQRLVLRLLFAEQMTVPQAATVLGVDEQTIRSTKHKALTRLREHLDAR